MDLKSWEKLFPLQYPSRFQGKPAKVFLAGLAWAMPNHWVCESCMKLHHISKGCSTFGSKKNTYNSSGSETLWQPVAATIHHSRIQTALKLTRMKNNGVFVDCRLLNKVLQSHEITSRCEWNDTLRRCNRVQGVISTKVIRGTFILYARVERTRCEPISGRVGLLPGDVDRYTLCKHITHRGGKAVFPLWQRYHNSASSPLGFSCNLMAAFEKRGTPVKGYCKYCLLDYILVATADSFIVESWQSLGRYDRPQDALTDKPLFGDLPPEDGCWPLLSGADLSPRSGVALMGGELVCHQPGSVRDAYMSE